MCHVASISSCIVPSPRRVFALPVVDNDVTVVLVKARALVQKGATEGTMAGISIPTVSSTDPVPGETVADAAANAPGLRVFVGESGLGLVAVGHHDEGVARIGDGLETENLNRC